MLPLEGKLFNSSGCLLLVHRDDFQSSEFTIYEMMKGSSVWSVRYHVDTDDFMSPLPEGSTVWSIVLGEREDNSFLVINLSGKVVEYNLMSKNLREMYDMGSNQLIDNYHDGFIPPGFILPFAMYDMRSKQVDHKVYEFISSYRVSLGAKERGKVEFVVKPREHFSSTNEDGLMVIEEGTCSLVVGDQEYTIDMSYVECVLFLGQLEKDIGKLSNEVAANFSCIHPKKILSDASAPIQHLVSHWGSDNA
ncbi:hypothetical protein Tco_0667033 [Tanacetum coccineum]